jgi:hypothetical protein
MKRYLSINLVCLIIACVFSSIPLMSQTNIIRVYRNDVFCEAFSDADVDSITFRRALSSQGFTTQVISTAQGDQFETPLENVDSVVVTSEYVGKPVDLGLSVLWADRNIGAVDSIGFGGLYGWADPTGIKTSTAVADYVNSELPNEISGTYSDITVARWGGLWRLPSHEDEQELLDKCTWEWMKSGTHYGYKVTGPNGNSIFLSAGGSRYGTAVDDRGGAGHYWSGTLNGSDNTVWNISFEGSFHKVFTFYAPSYGFFVRPVMSK